MLQPVHQAQEVLVLDGGGHVLPLRFEFTSEELESWIQGDRTTLIDVELLRLPSPEIFKLVS